MLLPMSYSKYNKVIFFFNFLNGVLSFSHALICEANVISLFDTFPYD